MGQIVKILFIAALAIILLSGTAQASEWNTQTIISDPNNYYPMISGDGKKVVYVHNFDPQANDGSGNEIMLYDVESGTAKRLTNNGYWDTKPEIDDDGSTIVYIRGTPDEDYIKVINSEGTELVSLELPYSTTPHLAISGNGNYVAYSIEQTGNHTLWAMKSDGTDKRKIAQDTGWWFPSWLSNDGSTLLYIHDSSVYVVNRADGQEISHVESTYLMDRGDISGDGSRVVYEDGNDIKVMNSVGTGKKTLAADNESPMISEDGSKIAFIGYTSDYLSNNLYTINWDGTGLELVATIDDYNANNGISMDKSGSTFTYISDNGYVRLITRSQSLVNKPNNMSAFNGYNIGFGASTYSPGTVRFSSAEADSGTVSIPVKGIDLKKVGSMNLGLKYDPALLKFKSAAAGSLTGHSLVDSNDAGNGLINVGIVDTNGINGNGSIAVLTFEVIENAPVQSCDLLVQSLKVTNTTGKTIYLSSINGTFTATSMKGDVNGDGKITSVDALMALQMSTGKQGVNLAADMDGDGQVTAADALEILRQSTSAVTTPLQGPADRRSSSGSSIKPGLTGGIK